MELIRTDIAQRKLLEQKFNLESISYDDVFWMLHDFIRHRFLTKSILDDLKISTKAMEKINLYLQKMADFLNSRISKNELEKYRIDAWESEKKSIGNDRHALRFIVCGLYDRERSLMDDEDYDSSEYIGLLFSCLFKFGNASYCEIFREFLERHPRMEKYKIN